MTSFYRHELRRILKVAEENNTLLRHILRAVHPPSLTRSIAVRFTGATMANSLTLTVGQTSQASIVPLLADGVTPSGGTLSSVAFTFSDPSATVTLNADGQTATVTGVAASTGAVQGSASCIVTDTDGVISSWTQTFSITTNAGTTVTPPPPSQLTQSIEVNFTAPTGGTASPSASAAFKRP